MTDLVIVKLMMRKENLDKYGGIVYSIKTEPEIYKILLAISKYYEEYPNHVYLSVDEIETYFYSEYPSQQSNRLYTDLFGRLRSLEVSDSLASDIVIQYLEKDSATECMKALVPILSGDSKNGILQLPEIIARFKEKALIVDEEKSPFIEDNLESLLDLLDKRGGLKWGLTHLNDQIGPLPSCTLGHIFARVESGKTTLVASQVQSFVGQLNPDQRIVWICNEEHGRFVKLRCYQSILNLTSPEIVEYIRSGRRDELEEKYLKNGGDKLKIHYDPNISMEGIRAILEKTPPRVVIVDIADHVGFRGGDDLNGPAKLGELYRRFRSFAGHFQCDIITVGQASAECDGKKVIHIDNMHNSRTDKPGALDYAIGMGKTYDPNDAELRWLTIGKNKIGCTTKETSPVRIDTLRGRFYDV